MIGKRHHELSGVAICIALGDLDERMKRGEMGNGLLNFSMLVLLFTKSVKEEFII